MSFCKRCGASLNEEEKFCSRCGAKTSILTKNNIKLIPYDWALVFAFVLYFIIDQSLLYLVSSGSLIIHMNIQNLSYLLMLVYAGTNGSIALLDTRQLEHKLKDAPSTFFALFLVPVYLFKRGTITKNGRYPFWIYMCILLLMVLVENSQSVFRVSLFTSNFQKIEALKSVEFDGTHMSFANFIKNKTQHVKYSTFSNEKGNYIAVTLTPNEITVFPVLIYNFKVEERGELISFSLTDAAITFDGNNWDVVNQNIASILLFSSNKKLSSIKPIDIQNPIRLLSDSEKIEQLKNTQFFLTNSTLDKYIERKWPSKNYEVSFNAHQDSIAVTISQNTNKSYPEKVTFYFLMNINEISGICSELDHMVVYYKDKKPLFLRYLYAWDCLFARDSNIMKKSINEILPFVNK